MYKHNRVGYRYFKEKLIFLLPLVSRVAAVWLLGGGSVGDSVSWHSISSAI